MTVESFETTPSATAQTVAERLARLQEEQKSLLGEAETERKELAARFVSLCGLLGPVPRDFFPPSCFRRKPRTVKANGGNPKTEAPASKPKSKTKA